MINFCVYVCLFIRASIDAIERSFDVALKSCPANVSFLTRQNHFFLEKIEKRENLIKQLRNFLLPR